MYVLVGFTICLAFIDDMKRKDHMRIIRSIATEAKREAQVIG